ncbi:Lcl domain-containing protein [Pseudoalteromonas aurantia]|uniref:SH3b domain-containing protein n=1 Tax=Pseudoalteromonas aurantia 208 TaxID=1314867 RepID=A0ABR9EB75_9GAMM|nr:DUF1566 domain-containing protein [Pseudoalteromonas aurantia]MBE0367038.1 hypothetical protein [Pseudoalteromonas aurantia 208]
MTVLRFFLLAFSFFIPLFVQAAGVCDVVEVVKNVNVRNSPHKAGEKLGYIKTPQRYVVNDSSGKWASIYFGETGGWAYAPGYLNHVESSCVRITNVTSGVNVRAEASSSSEKLGRANKGSLRVVKATHGNWQEIWFAGRTGFIHKNYLETADEAFDVTSTPSLTTKPLTAYEYAITTSDPLVEYQLDSGPSGMSLVSNKIVWTPNSDQVGEHGVKVILTSLTNRVQVNHEFTLTVEPVEQYTACDAVEVIKGVNVRVGAGSNFEKIGYLTKNQKYKMLNKAGSWYQIWFNEQAAWVYGKGYLKQFRASCTDSVKAKKAEVFDLDNRSFTPPHYASVGSQWVIKGAIGEYFEIFYNASTALIEKTAFLDPAVDAKIISNPVTELFAHQYYAYQIALNVSLYTSTLSLVEAPVGMTLSATGLLQWYPEEGNIGTHTVGLELTSETGGVSAQTFSVNVSATPTAEHTCEAVTLKRNLSIRTELNDPNIVEFVKGDRKYLVKEQQGNFLHIFDGFPLGWVHTREVKHRFNTDCAKVTKEGGTGYREANVNSSKMFPLDTEWQFFKLKSDDEWTQFGQYNYYDAFEKGWLENQYVSVTQGNVPVQFLDNRVEVGQTVQRDIQHEVRQGDVYVYQPVLNKYIDNPHYQILSGNAGLAVDQHTGELSWLAPSDDMGQLQSEVLVRDEQGYFDVLQFNVDVTADSSQSCQVVEAKDVTANGAAVFASSTSQSGVGNIYTRQYYVIKEASSTRYEIYYDEQTRWVDKNTVQVTSSKHCVKSYGTRQVKDGYFNFDSAVLGNIHSGSWWAVSGSADESHQISFKGRAGWVQKSRLSSIPPLAKMNFIGSAKEYQPIYLDSIQSQVTQNGFYVTYQWRLDGELISRDGFHTLSGLRAGDYQLSLTVIEKGRSDTVHQQFKVLPANIEPPSITSIPQYVAVIGEAYLYQVTATEQPTSYELLSAPDGMYVTDSGQLVMQTPGGEPQEQVSLQLNFSNDVSLIHSYRLNTAQDNSPPTIYSSPTTDAQVGVEYRYAVNARDAQVFSPYMYLKSAPHGMAISNGNKVVWTPSASDVGDVAVELVVTDGHMEALQAFTITVRVGADYDNDGIPDTIDYCPETPDSEAVNELGCSDAQMASQHSQDYSQVPKTGSHVSYGTFDDGFYQRGVQHTFERETENVIKNTVTGQLWADIDSGLGEVKWQEAQDYCQNMQLDGHSDWRLPNRFELFYLLDRSQSGSYLPKAFNALSQHTFWDGVITEFNMTVGRSIRSAFIIDTQKGNFDSWNDVETSSAGVMCVQGKQEFIQDTGRFSGGRYDNTSRLLWEGDDTSRPTSTVQRTWHESVNYCENLSLAGFDNWRLPNVNEIFSLFGLYSRGEVIGYISEFSMWTSTASLYRENNVDTLHRNNRKYLSLNPKDKDATRAEIYDQHGYARCVTDFPEPEIQVDYQPVLYFGDALTFNTEGSTVNGHATTVTWALNCGEQDCRRAITDESTNKFPDVGQYSIEAQFKYHGLIYTRSYPLTVMRNEQNTRPTLSAVEDINTRFERKFLYGDLGDELQFEVTDDNVRHLPCKDVTACDLPPVCESSVLCDQYTSIEVVEWPDNITLGHPSIDGPFNSPRKFLKPLEGNSFASWVNYRIQNRDADLTTQMRVRAFDGQDYSEVVTVNFDLRRDLVDSALPDMERIHPLGRAVSVVKGGSYTLQPKLADVSNDFEITYVDLETNERVTQRTLELRNLTKTKRFNVEVKDLHFNTVTESPVTIFVIDYKAHVDAHIGAGQIFITSEGSANTAQWYLNGVLLPEQTSSSLRLTLGVGTHELKVSVTDSEGGQYTYIITVTVHDWPEQVLPEQVIAIDGEQKYISVDKTLSRFDGLTYEWRVDGQRVTDGHTSVYAFQASLGSYDVTVKVGNDNSKTYSTRVIVVPAKKNWPLDLLNPEYEFVGQEPVEIKAKAYSEFENYHYAWKVNKDVIDTQGANALIFDYPFGTYQLELTLSSPYGNGQSKVYRAQVKVVSELQWPAQLLDTHYFFSEDQAAVVRIDRANLPEDAQFTWLVDATEVAQNTTGELQLQLEAGSYELAVTVTSLSLSPASKSYTAQLEVENDAVYSACYPTKDLTDDELKNTVPENDIPWVGGGYARVEDIERGFNYARKIDSTVTAKLKLPQQSRWDSMSIHEQALYILNAERIARGLAPHHAISNELNIVSQTYAQYLLDNNTLGHIRAHDNATVVDRIVEQLGDINQILPQRWGAGEVIVADQASTTSSESIAKALYVFLYQDKYTYSPNPDSFGPPWAHRQGLLIGMKGAKGVIGLGIAKGLYTLSGQQWFANLSVLNTVYYHAPSWPSELGTLVTTDVSEATRCANTSIELPHDDLLTGINVYPERVDLVPGMTQQLTVMGTYNNGETKTLDILTDLEGPAQNIFSFANNVVTAKQAGTTELVIRAGDVLSSPIEIQVGEPTVRDEKVSGFAKQYQHLIADNATIKDFPESMMAIYNGVITNNAGTPLAGATIAFAGSPEFGSVKSNAQGAYAIAGRAGSVSIEASMVGYLRVQTTLVGDNLSWNHVSTISLQAIDQKATTITLSEHIAHRHQSTPVVDEFGERSTTLVFDNVTQVTVKNPNGSRRQLNKITVRATEFEKPASMPGSLPVETAFTYCSELDIAGVADNETVEFDQPVAMYVDNFLNFPVGELVPVGYYDRVESKWKAAENGVVVKLLDSNNDGVIDGADYTGDDVADDIDGDGETIDEVAGIENYEAGKTYWRGQMRHFTPYDFNWSANSDGAPPTEVDILEGDDKEVDEDNDECAAVSSYIKPKTLELHEDITVLGTGMTLHYNSARTSDYHHIIKANVSDLSLPQGVNKIHAVLEVAGHRFEQLLDATIMQQVTFKWDGLDVQGNAVKGEIKAKLRVGYEYTSQYLSAGNIAQSGLRPNQESPRWAQWGGDSLNVAGREALIKWSNSVVTLYAAPESDIANGWSLSNHHRRDRVGNLYLGDGEIEKAPDSSTIVDTGVTLSVVDGDDGFYTSVSKPLDYTVTTEGHILDNNTQLMWQAAPSTGLYTKAAASAYCDALPDRNNSYWRLPRFTDILYTVDKSGKERDIFVYTINSSLANTANTIWLEDSLDQAQTHKVLCVAGQEVGLERTGSPLKRKPALELVDNRANAMQWQDTPDNVGGQHTWREAINYCEDLTHAGFSDWRLPTVNEFIKMGANNLFFGMTAFAHEDVNVADGENEDLWHPYVDWRKLYWTSTPNIGAPELEAWAVEMSGFGYHGYSQQDELANVRCIRKDLDSKASQYHFNKANQHVSTLDKETGKLLLTFEYAEAHNKLNAIVDRFGNTLRIERDDAGQVTQLIAPSGLITTLEIDEQHNLKRVEYPDGSMHQFSYIGQLLNHQIDPNGNVFERFFNADGRITRSEDPEGGAWRYYSELSATTGEFIYGYTTAQNNRFEITESINDGAKQVSTRRLDGTTDTLTAKGLGYIHQVGGMSYEMGTAGGGSPVYYTVKSPGGIKINAVMRRFSENNISGLTTETNERKVIESRHYKQAQKFVRNTSLGRATTTYYDPDTLLTTKTQIDGFAATHYEYDGYGRVTRVSQGERSSTYSYDDSAQTGPGFLASVVNSEMQQSDFSYDQLGQVIETLLSSGGSASQRTAFSYDKNGNVNGVTADGRSQHSFAFDGNNQVVASQPPVAENLTNTTISYVYDTDRRIQEYTRASGDKLTFIYGEGVDRLEAINMSQGLYEYQYDTAGNLTQIDAPNGSQTVYTYDGLIVKEATWSGAVSGHYGVTHNTHGLVNKACINADECIEYKYDADGLLTQSGAISLTRASDKGGAITHSTLAGLSHALTYNQYGQVSAQHFEHDATTLYSSDLQFDTVGRVTHKAQQVLGVDEVVLYEYDDVGRLAQVTLGEDVTRYDYDSNGNRLSVEHVSAAGTQNRAARYDAQDRLIEFAGCQYSYSVDGELATRECGTTTHSYTYTVFGNLQGVEVSDNGTLVKQITYQIDAEHRRVGKHLNGEFVASFLYAGGLNPIAQLNDAGEVVARFVYGSQSHVPDYLERDGKQYRIITDHIGSVRLVVDVASSEVMQALSYDAFGVVLSDSNPGFQPFGFAGGLYDHDTQLVRFGARDYDAATARWTAKDPVGFAGGDTNLYAYVGSDPVNFIDPTGHVAWLVLPAVKSLYGYAEDVAWQMLVEGKSFGCVDQQSALASGLMNALPAGMVAKYLGKVGKGATNVAQFEKYRSLLAANEILAAKRVGSALRKSDKNHLSASFLSKEQLASGKVFPLKGSDNVQRTLLQTKGNLDGKVGVFEYILEPNGQVSHQLFKKGKINGIPTKITQ